MAPGDPPRPEFPSGNTNFVGKVFWADHFASERLWAVATHTGENWTKGQHFYVAEDGAPQLEELDIAGEMIVERPTLVKMGARTVLVLGRWHSWNLSPTGKLGRYLRSYGDETLRPEFSLYLYDLSQSQKNYWGPGHTLLPSPDRRRALLLRSGALGAGYYSIHLWHLEQDRLETILSLREADPGSGRSFWYRWSSDSKAVHIGGSTGGLERRKRAPRELNLVYLVGEGTIYEAGGPGAGL